MGGRDDNVPEEVLLTSIRQQSFKWNADIYDAQQAQIPELPPAKQ